MAEIFILTSKVNRAEKPVAAVTDESVARQWALTEMTNDYYPLEVDRMDHLGLGNGQMYGCDLTMNGLTRDQMPIPEDQARTVLTSLMRDLEEVVASFQELESALIDD